MPTALPRSKKKLHALIAALRDELQSQQKMLAARDAQLKENSALIEKLKFELARLKRWRFGKHTEALSAEQLALWEAELDGDIAALQARVDALEEEKKKRAADQNGTDDKSRPKRRLLPDTLPRVDVLHDLESKDCPKCKQALERIGEEISEQLDIIPAKFFVRRHVRSKYCCRRCETLHIAAMPPQPIDKGLPAPGLITHVATNKYLNHLPLYRQEAEFERMGVPIPRSSMAGWFGALEVLLDPLVHRIIEVLLAERIVHADETPVPVLDPGAGKTATGYLWAYRSGPFSTLQAVAFDFTMSREGKHPTRFLEPFAGTLIVDGYSGYNAVLARDDVMEAGCMAHARRAFHEIAQASNSPIAKAALIYIGELYGIEAELKHLPPEPRAAQRQARASPVLSEFKHWLDQHDLKTSNKSAIGKAIRYATNRWPALTRYLDDAMLNIDNNPVENAIRGVALGKKNWLFAGSEAGGRRAAQFYTLIESAKLNDVNPNAYLKHVLTTLPSARAKDLDALLPWNFNTQSQTDPIV